MTATRRLAVVSAGTSQPSSTRLLADRLADATVRALVDTPSTVDTVEVRDVAHDLTNHVLTGFAAPALQERLDLITGADAVIVATPIYSASYSGLFKMLVDVLPAGSLRGRPVLLAATGGSARHSLAIDHALRPLFAHLGALVSPTAVFAASEDWGSVEAGRLGERIERAGQELARLVVGAAPERAAEAEVTPFQTLLAEVTPS